MVWFKWGFFLMVVPIISAPILALTSYIHVSLLMLCNSLLSCGIGCGGLAWWITGIVWRFKASGAFASGDSLTDDELKI